MIDFIESYIPNFLNIIKFIIKFSFFGAFLTNVSYVCDKIDYEAMNRLNIIFIVLLICCLIIKII